MMMGDILSIIMIYTVVFIIPLAVTLWNIHNFRSEYPVKERLAGVITVFVGGILYFLDFGLILKPAGDWYEQVYPDELHRSISSQYELPVNLVLILGLAALFILLFVSAHRLPPLISVMCVAALILFNLFQLVYAVQIAENMEKGGVLCLLLYVYHANLLLLSASVIRKQVIGQVQIAKEKGMDLSEQGKYRWIYGKMSSISKYTVWVFIALFFLIAVLEIIFVLWGQGIDAPVKAFTDTADWTFSTQIPPPPKEFEGHYLCTVAAAGHNRVVKPLRLGTRRGKTIIVNRQLCIANAFEEYIQEKLPKFHRAVRSFYNRYGYPISRHITTPLRADIVYLAMKPLEWLFLIFLYLTDINPEKRIAVQYKYCGGGCL